MIVEESESMSVCCDRCGRTLHIARAPFRGVPQCIQAMRGQYGILCNECYRQCYSELLDLVEELEMLGGQIANLTVGKDFNAAMWRARRAEHILQNGIIAGLKTGRYCHGDDIDQLMACRESNGGDTDGSRC